MDYGWLKNCFNKLMFIKLIKELFELTMIMCFVALEMD